MRHRYRLALLLSPLALLPLTGCGGGAGSVDSTSTLTSTGTSRAALDVYVTDGFTDAYKSVLVTLYKIELTTDGKTFTTVFSDAAGQTLDLTSLSATATLLASVNAPTGTYTQARITFGDHVTLVNAAGTTSSIAVDPTLGTAASGQIAITVATPTRVQIGQTNTVLVDFKLAEFKLVGNLLQPLISCGDEGSFGGRQRNGHLSGTIANLTSTGFTLQNSDGRTLTVVTNASTTITSGQTGKVATLTNGISVMVQGTVDATTKVITATAVTINDYTTFAHERAGGTVASVNATAGSFVLTIQHTDGLKPTGATITVVTNATTVFRKGRQAATLTDVAAGGIVEVGGSFDVPTQTLTATSVEVRSVSGGGGEGFGHGGGPDF